MSDSISFGYCSSELIIFSLFPAGSVCVCLVTVRSVVKWLNQEIAPNYPFLSPSFLSSTVLLLLLLFKSNSSWCLRTSHSCVQSKLKHTLLCLTPIANTHTCECKSSWVKFNKSIIYPIMIRMYICVCVYIYIYIYRSEK